MEIKNDSRLETFNNYGFVNRILHLQTLLLMPAEYFKYQVTELIGNMITSS